MATVGRRAAIADIALIKGKTLKLTGTLAWLAWLFVHIVMLLGNRNRLATLVNLSTKYLAPVPPDQPDRRRCAGVRAPDPARNADRRHRPRRSLDRLTAASAYPGASLCHRCRGDVGRVPTAPPRVSE